MDIPSTANQLRGTSAEQLLLLIAEAGGQGQPRTTLGIDDLSDFATSEAAAALRSLGLARQDHSLAGEVTLTEFGHQVSQRIKQSRADGEDRWDAVTRAVALGVLSEASNGWRVAEVDGRPATDNELHIAVNRLERWDCARVVRAWGDEIVKVLPRARIRELPAIQGRLVDALDGHSVSLDHSTHNVANVTNQGQMGVVQVGEGNIANLSYGLPDSLRSDLASQVSDLLVGMRNEVGASDLIESIEVIRSELEQPGSTKPSIKEKVVVAMTTAGATAASSAVTTAALQGLASILHQLG